MKNKKWIAIGAGIFMVLLMVSSILSVMNWRTEQSDEPQQQGGLLDTLCTSDNHTIVYNGKVYSPCEEEQYSDCWECMNNRVYIR